jgi:threonine/homoserine/homoserine lactone efflux protein
MVWLSRQRSTTVGFGCLFGCAIMMLSAMATVAGVLLLVRALFRALVGSH